MDLTVQHLRYFLAVAESLHFTRAAERLRIAPPSLSQQIAALERRLGVALFHRTSRRVELTAAGAELLPLARHAVASVDDVLAWADRRRAAGTRLRLGLVVGNRITAAILAAAAERLPDVRWEVRRVGFAEPVELLRAGRVDAVLAPAARPPEVPGVRAVPLWREGRVLVVSATHPLAGRPGVGIEETNAERFVAADTGPELADWFVVPRAGGVRPRVDPEVTTFEEVLEVCAAGLGVNIAGSTAAVSHARADLAYVPVTDVPEIAVYLLRPPATRGVAAALERIAVRVARREAGRCGGRPLAQRSSPTERSGGGPTTTTSSSARAAGGGAGGTTSSDVSS
ncbi:DNA-binding transcriptional regulator, LysR family [Amycolatopsis arida]|uniref:DNA-binding transcriptional regulator, LysR family n=1 Tax=Amycolatopsis arida TaxID=587909 RepID=A0A1I5SPR6_9PSEU|nr:LysR family transcriptional regulator [Amycolatopsis arida]TDX96394.1 DNA-binding transcriptional LysR family regulator [Amycolatopsis arida]SFP72784.1 DNA-binding transcriptional regulator, LysR family [Amycolatopsis arida]